MNFNFFWEVNEYCKIVNFRMFSKLKGYRRLKEQEDEEKKYQEYKDNWVKKGDGTYDNKGYTQEEKKNTK